MNPKEKAKELVDKFENVSFGKAYKAWDENKITRSTAKQCALICVDEVIAIVPYNHNSEASWITDIETVDYWEEVKQEIEKL